MGSFNSVCCITNLPIGYGDETVSMFVTSPRFEDQNGIHSRKYHTPYGFPFRTIYDDYGQFIIKPAQPSFAMTLERMKKQLVEFPKEDEYHKGEVSAAKLTKETVWEYIHKDRLFVKDQNQQKNLQIECIHMHATAWEYLFEEFTIDLMTSKTYTFTEYHEYVMKKVDEAISEMEERLKPALTDKGVSTALSRNGFIFNFAFHDLQRYFDNCRTDSNFSVSDVFIDKLNEDMSNDDIKKVISIGLEVEWIWYFFVNTKKQFTVSSYGGQEVDTQLYRSYANLILRMCDDIDKYYEEW